MTQPVIETFSHSICPKPPPFV
ncbi:hypothetical protein CBM2626_B140031 [Cupriavidus taiwanensis]|nr:hypothetical protein CBM2626_B140031 [Cupriavidus taiwanensis]